MRAVAVEHRAEKKIRTFKTSFVNAAESSNHEYQKGSNIVDLTAFYNGRNGEGKEFIAGTELLRHQPELAEMPQKLNFYCMESGVSMTSKLLHVKGGGTLCSTPTWAHATETVLQSIKAAHTFHGSPWFDSVSVLSEQSEVWYCELRLLFQYQEENLVFVQWYEEEAPAVGDILCQYGCICLKKLQSYDVLPLEAVSRREFIVPDYQTKQVSDAGHVTYKKYHVSAFKSDRSSVGFKQDPVDEYGFALA